MAITQDWTYENDVKGSLGSTSVHGICMTTSCHWAKNSLKAGKKMASKPNVNLVAAGAMHVVMTKQWNQEDAAGNSPDWHQNYFDRMSIKGTLAHSGVGSGWNITSASGIYLLSIYGAGGGHTMGFARFTSHSVFFDPNYGQFSCPASVFSSFKSDVKARVEKYNLLNNWYVYRLTL